MESCPVDRAETGSGTHSVAKKPTGTIKTRATPSWRRREKKACQWQAEQSLWVLKSLWLWTGPKTSKHNSVAMLTSNAAKTSRPLPPDRCFFVMSFSEKVAFSWHRKHIYSFGTFVNGPEKESFPENSRICPFSLFAICVRSILDLLWVTTSC